MMLEVGEEFQFVEGLSPSLVVVLEFASREQVLMVFEEHPFAHLVLGPGTRLQAAFR